MDIDAGSVADDAARVTLAELLVALVTFGLVAAAVVTLLDEGQRAWAYGAARAETQQSARVAMARLTAEIRGRLDGAILRREAGGGAQPIINGVRALTLTYFDAAGAPTTTPAEVRSVEIVLVTRPDYSVAGSSVSTVLTTHVRLRNR